MKQPEYKKWFPEEFQDLIREPDEEEIEIAQRYRDRIDYAAEIARDIDLSDFMHWIVDFLGGKHDLLSNALFIKFYKKADVRPPTLPIEALIYGIIAGTFLSVVGMIFAVLNHNIMEFLFVITPVFVLLLVAWTRVEYSTIIETPMKIAREVDHGVIHSVYTTPMTDSEIYHGASMPFLVRSFVFLESIYHFVAGYYIPFFVFNLVPVFRSIVAAKFEYSEYFIYITIGLFVLMVLIPLCTLLESRATGLYSIIFSRVGTVWATFGHSMFIFLLVMTIGYMVIMPYVGFKGDISFSGILFGIGIGSGLMILAYWYACVITEQIGIMVLGKSRRGPRADPVYRRLKYPSR